MPLIPGSALEHWGWTVPWSGPQQLKGWKGLISQSLSFSKKGEHMKDSVQLKEENTQWPRKLFILNQVWTGKVPPQISHTSLFT